MSGTPRFSIKTLILRRSLNFRFHILRNLLYTFRLWSSTSAISTFNNQIRQTIVAQHRRPIVVSFLCLKTHWNQCFPKFFSTHLRFLTVSYREISSIFRYYYISNVPGFFFSISFTARVPRSRHATFRSYIFDDKNDTDWTCNIFLAARYRLYFFFCNTRLFLPFRRFRRIRRRACYYFRASETPSLPRPNVAGSCVCSSLHDAFVTHVVFWYTAPMEITKSPWWPRRCLSTPAKCCGRRRPSTSRIARSTCCTSRSTNKTVTWCSVRGRTTDFRFVQIPDRLVRIRRVAFASDAKVRVYTKRELDVERVAASRMRIGKIYSESRAILDFLFFYFIDKSMKKILIFQNEKESGRHHSTKQGGSFDIPRSYSAVKYTRINISFFFIIALHANL